MPRPARSCSLPARVARILTPWSLLLLLTGPGAGAVVAPGPGHHAPAPVIPLSCPQADLDPAAMKQYVLHLTAATPVIWPAGGMSLGSAIARLGAQGNSTSVAPGVDLGRSAQLPAVTTYWDGVLAVCAAFGLEILPGTGIGAQTGPVVLAPRSGQSPPAQAIGAALVVLQGATFTQVGGAPDQSWFEGRPLLRWEPRIKGSELQTERPQFETSDAGSLAIDMGLRRRLMLAHLGIGVNRVTITGSVGIIINRHLAIDTNLDPGQTLHYSLGAAAISLGLELRGDEAVITTVMPAQCSLQSQTMSQGTAQFYNGSSNSSSDGRTMTDIRSYQNAPPRSCHVKESLQIQLFSWQIPISCSLDIAGLREGRGARAVQPPAASPLAPMHVSWPAGAAPLAEAVKRLSAGGNQILLDLDVDERAKATLPAFDGVFWDGVAAVCRAYHLRVMPAERGGKTPAANPSQFINGIIGRDDSGHGPSSPVAFSGGPVRLGPLAHGPLKQVTAVCGGIAITVSRIETLVRHGLDGDQRFARITMELRLEPRIDTSRLYQPVIKWASELESPSGAAQVAADFHAPGPFPPRPSAGDPGLAVVLVRIPAGPLVIDLHGLLTMKVRDPIHWKGPVRIGDERPLLLGGILVPLRISRVSGSPGVAVAMTLPSQVQDMIKDVQLLDEHGAVIKAMGMSGVGNGEETQDTWTFAGQEGVDTYVLRIKGHHELSSISQAIDVQLAVPGMP